MPIMQWYPLKLKPRLHAKVWGGRRLATKLNIRVPDAGTWGEAWALHDSCVVVNGGFAGGTLGELLTRHGSEILGAESEAADGMPLLAKFIDAAQWLSIQTHPNDDQARQLEGEPRGKTEAWLVLDANPGAELVAGVRAGLTKTAMETAMREGKLEDHLRYVSVASGDAFFIPAGTIHALGPGILIYEIQQSSDITYRLYDWGRVGLDGAPRLLHVEKGSRVADLESRPQAGRSAGEKVIDEGYFTLWRHRLGGERRDMATGGRFQALSCVSGRLTVTAGGMAVEIAMGETALVPACLERFDLRGAGVALRSCAASPS